MIVENSLDELKKREAAYGIIKNFIESDDNNDLYDLTGLSGGFIADKEEIKALPTPIS